MFPGEPFTTLITSTRRANHKYSGFMDFMRWRAENVKGALVWSLTGKQTRHRKESAERQDYCSVNTFGEMDVYSENTAK